MGWPRRRVQQHPALFHGEGDQIGSALTPTACPNLRRLSTYHRRPQHVAAVRPSAPLPSCGCERIMRTSPAVRPACVTWVTSTESAAGRQVARRRSAGGRLCTRRLWERGMILAQGRDDDSVTHEDGRRSVSARTAIRFANWHRRRPLAGRGADSGSLPVPTCSTTTPRCGRTSTWCCRPPNGVMVREVTSHSRSHYASTVRTRIIRPAAD
jgi:hypothetical protein